MRKWREEDQYRYIWTSDGYRLYGVGQWPEPAYPVVWVYDDQRPVTRTHMDTRVTVGPSVDVRMRAAQVLAYGRTYV